MSKITTLNITQQDTTTLHVSEKLASGIASINGSVDVSPILPDVIIPSVIALYDDPTPSTESSDRRERGTLLGWSPLGYMISLPEDTLIGTPAMSQYKAVQQSDGTVKNTVVCEFNEVQAIGKITKIRLYGNRIGQAMYDAKTEGYVLNTKRCPSIIACPNIGNYKAVKNVKFGLNDTNLAWTPNSDEYRAFRKSSVVCGEYIAYCYSGDDTKVIVKVKKLHATYTNSLPLATIPEIFSIELPTSVVNYYHHYSIDVGSDGSLYVCDFSTFTQNITITKYNAANNYTAEQIIINTPSGLLGTLIPASSTMRIVNDKLYYSFQYDDTSAGTKFRYFASWDLTLNSEISNFSYGDDKTYPVMDLIPMANGDIAIGLESFTNKVDVSSFEYYAYSCNKPEGAIDSDYIYQVIAKPKQSMHGFSAADKSKIGNMDASILGYDSSRQAIALYNSKGDIAWTPVAFSGPEMILAESRIPEYIKTDQDTIRVVFDYFTKTTFA